MTTSGAEKSNLLRRGFRDDSVKALYENIKKLLISITMLETEE